MAKKARTYGGMTTQEREFAKALITTGSVPEAAALAGVSERNAYRMKQRPAILRFFAQALERAGINDDAIVKVIKDAMSAEKMHLLPDGAGGVTIQYEPDHRTRLVAVDQMTETALKLRAIEKNMIEDEQNEGIPENLADMNIAELTKLLSKRAGR